MIRDQIVDERDQLWKLPGSREQKIFFSHKVDFYFIFEMLLDFGLPCQQIRVWNRLCSVDTDAQRQRTLVLVRKWNQIFIAKHIRNIIRRRISCSVAATKRSNGSRCAHWFRGFRKRWPQRQPVGANSLPLLNQHAIGFKKGAYT